MDRLTSAERLVLTALLGLVALSAAWKYWRVDRIARIPVPESVWELPADR